MIKRIVVKGLFERFNYDVKFSESNITILTGPNGFGKTTILKAIEAISKKDLRFFAELKFDSISFHYENKEQSVIRIVKSDNKLSINDMAFDLRSSFFSNSIYSNEVIDSNLYSRINQDFRSNYEFQFLDKPHAGLNDIDDEEKIDEKYYNYKYLIRTNKDFKKFDENIKILDSLVKGIDNVYSIRENRLYIVGKKRNLIAAISETPAKLKNHINRFNEKYSEIANQLDSTYPTRLFGNKTKINEVDFVENMKVISETFNKFKKFDLFVLNFPEIEKFEPKHAMALKVFFDDLKKKLDIYRPFIKQLETFVDIVNKRLLFKEVQISKEKGYIVIDENKNEIKLEDLSSGEKQEIGMFFNLVFGSTENSTVLIDEPEISLHIEWQQGFIDDLFRILELKNLNFIIATHSPYIVDAHYLNQIDLGELNSEC